ncbi:MAG: HAMP domain-containing sensor histidine kinase [Chloroflexota bacterium]
MSYQPHAGSEGVEALLSRTKRQITIFILVATGLVVGLVAIGGAVAGTNALDAGLDAALVERATRIAAAIQDELPPMPTPTPSAKPTPKPEKSERPTPSMPSESEDPGGDGNDDDEEGDGGSSGAHASVAVSARYLTIVRAYPPPSIPPDLNDEEYGAGGPWAVLSPEGAVLALSTETLTDFPIVTQVYEANGPIGLTVVIGRAEYRVITIPLRHPQDPTGPALAYVQVAGRLDVRDAQRQNLFSSLIFVVLLSLGAALGVALLITRRALAPIAAAAARERAMVASASHELRTPTSVILSSAEILERENLVKPAGIELLRGIVAESERLGRLSADLVTLQGGGVKLGAADLGDIARSAFERARPMVQKSHFSLSEAIELVALPVSADRDRLIQLVLGLVENAMRHSPPRGAITIGAGGDAVGAAIWVDDSGVGVQESEREKIFEPFYRGAGAARTDGGAGLGLAIARNIALAHNGTITAESSPAGGARMIVRIPLSVPRG